MKSFEVSNGVMIYYLPKELDHYAAEKIKKKSELVFREEDIKYYKPESICPKCGRKVEREEANPLQLVFQRHSLEAIMNS